MSDREDNTTNERPGTSTDSGAQNMPSANVFADMFKAALAPVLSQLTTLNKNVSAVLLNEHEDSEEDGEAASNDRPAMSADMDAHVSALLFSAGKDDNTEAMPGEDLLKELAQELAVSEKTSPPLREGRVAIFKSVVRKDGGREAQGQTGQISSSRECQGFANPESESLNLAPAFDFHENLRCKIAEEAKHSYRRYFSHDKSRRFGAGKIQQRQRTDHLADSCHGPPIRPRGESLPTPGHEERDA